MPIYNTTSSTLGASIIGQLPAGTAPLGSVAVLQATMPWTINSIYGNISGSVAAFVVGSSSIITVEKSSSILAVPVGSTLGYWDKSPSIVGTYAEDAAHTSADKGLATWGVRNDTTASLASADLDYTPYAVDAVGRTIIKPFVAENGTIISYVGSLVSGSVTLIQASVIGKKTYVTDIILSNTGATTTLATIQDGTTSIMGQFIVPTGGGLVATGLNIPLKPVVTAGSDLAWKVSPSSSVVYLTLKGYQAQ